MTDFTRSFEIMVDASVHDVFEYCRDPRRLFEGWPQLEVVDVAMTPGGVGTKAHIVGRFARGMMVEQIEREFTELVPDERIVSKAHAKVRFAGRTKDVANGPVFTWLFEAEDKGTKLTLVVLEEDLSWWQNLIEAVSAVVMAKNLNSMLAAIKTGVESQPPGHEARSTSRPRTLPPCRPSLPVSRQPASSTPPGGSRGGRGLGRDGP